MDYDGLELAQEVFSEALDMLAMPAPEWEKHWRERFTDISLDLAGEDA